MKDTQIDHLFRHHSGKMISVLTRIFGLSNLEIIEDAIQDTFLKASSSWQNKQPENPEAWLTQAAKNRVLDIFRKLKTEQKHLPEIKSGIEVISINELFLDTEIEDAQLRMIFTACHPNLAPKDRITFALKTISGFSIKEIASALLTKEETIKKRLLRARKTIKKTKLEFKIPQGNELPHRIESVLEVLYLIFNEGFHSNKKEILIQKELCGEAMRLCKSLLKNKHTNISASYALFGLMCFHAARLDAKINTENELLDLREQDRNKWSFPLIQLGNAMMNKAVEGNIFSSYHYEAAIAAEHIKAPSFKQTNWDKILQWYQCLHKLQPNPSHLLTMAVVCLQNKNYIKANYYFEQLQPDILEQRSYLFYGAKADYFFAINNKEEAIKNIDLAIEKVTNKFEKEYLKKKKITFKN
ncbi:MULTISPECIES: RNA polymerase sigma factor [unclassified Tenacibaculum]|uniref:RNA polymerase sigma factor n=1 Tax=unclassified Tenacibaculum TaxID=2635139 RepID=UPI001F459AB9|nr:MULTISPECIES: sigma-70 family RNA polymerase sigma factor [unclassified Tenacibaculum]MCF2874478.1 sigma-70 family RNA polymerase sigma factor [Tenacibaculum sp. Cn5-1]MCF2934456.1 sigma-70 family RNA polymerase sigma factor [Tenacibaculum sp. Cn5-34]MCG7510666.1 sigma-70 family RNA polymerase sigma factor [Tenacibaculum sp. Cn5-46]